VQLQPPYALVTAGAGLHWMDWNIVMLRFADLIKEKTNDRGGVD
jgi:hypothetical protein